MGNHLKTTPLTAWHRSNGARMVDFAGFDMPVMYEATKIQEEVRTVRQNVGLFDLCHMGRLLLRGPDRVAATDHILTRNVDAMPLGTVRYALICQPDGTVVDDVLVYKGEDVVHVVINAANRATDDNWFRTHSANFDVEIDNVSDAQAMIALQGPESRNVLSRICDAPLGELKYYRYTTGRLLDRVDTLISRTGYTGEDGFELFFPPEEAVAVWTALLEAGQESGVRPIGLGARDVCRTEAGMPLYGQELSREIQALEAVEMGIDLDKNFIGADALRTLRDRGVPRKLVGLGVDGRRVPREGCPLLSGGAPVGTVTSGTFSPTLQRPIAMALLQADLAGSEASLEAELRGKTIPVRQEPLPFFSRKRKKKAK